VSCLNFRFSLHKKAIFLFIVLISVIFIFNFLSVFSAEQGKVINVDIGSSLNVRKGPGTQYDSLGRLYANNTVNVTGSANGNDGYVWYKIDFNNTTGYVRSDFIKIIATSVPTVAPTIKPTAAPTTKPTEAPIVDIEQILKEQNFPESYKTILREIHKEHPNWSFEALHTNLDWNTVVTAQMELKRNLVNKNSIASWKSTQEGAFNWASNSWIILSGSSSVQASEAIIKYFLDPRNFLTSSEIFQMEKLTYSDSQTIDGVNAIIKDTFMYNTKIENGLTYAEAFMEIGKKHNISPYFLAVRVRQEQGVKGTSALISGTYSETYKGYYNYFNVGASGASETIVIENGLKKAKAEGWNSRYASLDGGAKMIASDYILKGQDTLYLQKFDVDSKYNGLYWHQYMQTITAPQSEGYTARKAYNSMGLLDDPFVFKIPVYKNMPSTPCGKPTEDKNPNYKLSHLSVDGFSLSPAFNTETTSYNLTVEGTVDEINISAGAYAKTTKITGVGKISVKVGLNSLKVVSTAENGVSRTYTINVTRKNAPAYVEPTVSWSTLKTEGLYVYGFTVGSHVSESIKLIKVTNGSAKIYSADNKEKTSGLISTGDKIKIYDSNNVEKYVYSVIIFGDITGDGLIDGLDLVYMKRHVWGISYLKDIYLMAADVTHDSYNVDPLDLVYLKRHVWNVSYILQK